MTFKVGDIVKFTAKDGAEVVGILYENGNKMPGSFRVVTIGAEKFRGLNEVDLSPATKVEMGAYVKAAVLKLTPKSVIAKETEEAGGTLPEQLPILAEEEGVGSIEEEE